MAGTSAENLRSANERLSSEVEELRIRLDEAEQALEAIRTGQAESLVVEGPNGPRIFSLEGADHSYRVLVEAMNEGAATFGEDGTVFYCNARFAEMLDASLDRVMGGTIGRFISEHSRSTFDALVREANGRESRGEVELRSQSGKPVPAYVSLSVIEDEACPRYCLVAADLRAQKRNEEILAAERLARSVLEQAAEAIVVCDEEGRVIRASSMAAELAGRSPLLALFDAVFPVKVDLPPEGRSDDDVATFALQGGVLRAAPGVLELSDGSKADVLVSAAPLTGVTDRIIGCVVTMADITERTKAEKALRESEIRHRSVLENMSEGLMLFDALGDTIYQNPASLRLHGVVQAEGRFKYAELPTTWRGWDEQGRLLSFDDWPLSRVLRNEQFEGQVLRAERVGTGLEFWARYNGCPIHDGQGKLVYGFVTIADITAEVRAVSEQGRAEAVAEREREILAAVVKSIPDEVWVADANRTITLVNPAARKEFSLARGETVEIERLVASLEILRPDGVSRSLDETPLLRALAGETFKNQEELIRTPATGDLRWREASASPVRDAGGRIIGSVCVVRDVTDRKLAEEALRTSEERYRALFEHMAEGFFLAEVICDERGTPIDYRYLDANAAFDGLTGLARANVIGRTAREVLSGIEETWIEAYGRVALSGEPTRIEQFAQPLGRHYATLAYSPRRGQFACLFQDTTAQVAAAREQERLLAEAQAQRALLDAVIENLPVGIGIAEAPTGRLLKINDQTRRIWRLSSIEAGDATGYGKYVGFHPDGRQYASEDWQLVRAVGGESIEGEELEFVAGDGTHGFMRSTAAPVKDRNGNVVAAVVVIEDITERKQAEKNLRAANLKLAEADCRKDEFLAVLSHELRNPLAPIANSLYILDRAPAGGEQATRAKQILDRQVAHLTSLVNDLLDVTRITRSKIQLQKERLELNDVVRGVVEDSRSFFERAVVGLEFVRAPRAVHVIADRTRVAQVIGNLLQNAAKFTLKGGCTRVTIAEEESAAVVRVCDDGVGMSGETLAGLFQPFMQADHTLDRSKGGLGLGLALVKGIIELHGGSVSAHSDGLGKGTEFVVRLPLGTEVALGPAATRSARATTRRRILIIEDNVDAADSLREALELSDHEVAIAHDGPEGLAKARTFQPEAVLCDIGLPGMDGYEVARAFRKDELLRGTYLVALSGYALPEDIQRASEAGFDRHLAKPASVEKLEVLLAEVPGSSVQGDTTAHPPPTPPTS